MKIKTNDIAYKDGEVYRVTSLVTYIQNSDSNDEDVDGAQELQLGVENAGGGNYFVMETERWAFDKIDDLIAILEDFKKLVK